MAACGAALQLLLLLLPDSSALTLTLHTSLSGVAATMPPSSHSLLPLSTQHAAAERAAQGTAAAAATLCQPARESLSCHTSFSDVAEFKPPNMIMLSGVLAVC